MRKFFGKLPRKLLKAARHIIVIEPQYIPMPIYEGTTATMTRYIGWKTIDNYPYTKWVRKVIGKAKAATQKEIQRTFEEEVKRMMSFDIDNDEMFCRYERLKANK